MPRAILVDSYADGSDRGGNDGNSEKHTRVAEYKFIGFMMVGILLVALWALAMSLMFLSLPYGLLALSAVAAFYRLSRWP
jgi:hypothetical protein